MTSLENNNSSESNEKTEEERFKENSNSEQ